jgi:hypothetical protein
MQEPVEVEVAGLDNATIRPSFEDLYSEQFLPMMRLATLMCGRSEVARDIVQDSLCGCTCGGPACGTRRRTCAGVLSTAADLERDGSVFAEGDGARPSRRPNRHRTSCSMCSHRCRIDNGRRSS